MELKNLLFLTLFAIILCVNNADEFMPAIVGNKLVLFRVTDDERDKLLESMAKTSKKDAIHSEDVHSEDIHKEDTAISLEKSLKASESLGEKSGHKNEDHKKEDTHKKEHDSNEHNEKKSKQNKSEKSKKDHGLKEVGSYSSKIKGDKHGSSYSDTGHRSHYNRDKGHEFEKSWSWDKERGNKNSYAKTSAESGNRGLEDKGGQHGLKKWSADDRKNQGSHASHDSHGSEGHNKNVGSHKKQIHNDIKWRENSGHSSEEKQNNVHKSSPDGRNKYESESVDHNVYNHDTKHQDSENPQIKEENVNEKEPVNYDYNENNENKFNEYVERQAKTPHDSYSGHHSYHSQIPKSLLSPSPLYNPQITYHQTSPPNPQNHKRHQTYDGHYGSSSTVGIPKSDSEKWQVNSNENNANIRPETNSWSYQNRGDNHKNNNEPVMKSWSNGHTVHGYSYAITQSPVNYGSSNFGLTHNKAYLINH